MLYILYQDQNGENRFETDNSAYTPDFDNSWRTKNPNCKLIAVHDANADLTANEQTQRLQFNINCGTYGFRPADYRMRVRLNSGGLGELIGFNPRNRKYPCLIKPLLAGQPRIKTTPDYVKGAACNA